MKRSSKILKPFALLAIAASCLMASMPAQSSVGSISLGTPPPIVFPPTPGAITPACVTPPAGLVGWWKGDGDTLDSISANNGVNQNITFAGGVVGQAFACDPENYSYGTYTGIQIADQPAYALTNSLTIEGWVRPRGDGYIIFFRGDHRPGLDPYFLSMNGNSNLDFYITDPDGNSVHVETTLPYFEWTHVAATLDGSSGAMTMYTNGVLAAQTVTASRPFGDLIPGESPGVGIGNLNDGGNNFPFLGDIDEIDLYNRALSVGEIQAIYIAGSAGKCALTVPTNSCVTPPSGLISWWPGEGNTDDITGLNNGFVTNGVISDGAGEAGLAFHYDGSGGYVQVPASSSLNVGLGAGFTLEGWIQPGDLINQLPLFEWEFDGVQDGVHFWISAVAGAGCLYANVTDTADNSHLVYSPAGILTTGYQHVALTYDKTTGQAFIYRNGTQVANANLGIFTPRTASNLLLGARTYLGGALQYNYVGNLDELSVYGRALSQSEIQAIYDAGSAGKCLPIHDSSSLLLNVDFGSGAARGYSLKTGFAAMGQTTSDFWNFYDRDVSPTPYDWRNSGSLANLQTADGETTTVGMSVSDAPGAWNDASSDPMYATYDYPLDGGDNVVTFTNLPPGQYDVLAYSPDGNFEISVDGTSYGVKTSYDSPVSSLPAWTEGVQYARFRNVAVAAGQPLVLTVRNGVGGWAILSGVQVLKNVTPVVPAIYSVTPATGTSGATITISGTNFSTLPASNIVYFGAVRATVLAASPTNLQVTVPTGATFAPITVAVNELMAYAPQPFLPTFNGNGGSSSVSLAPRLDMPTGDGPGFTAFADLDGDGKPDLLICSGSSVSIFQNISGSGTVTAGSFAPRVDLTPPDGLDAMTSADVDGDGKLDIVLLNRNLNQVMILKNLSTLGILTTNSFAAPVAFATGSDPRGLAVRDLDGDGKPELIVGNWGDNTVSVFHNTGAAGITTNSFSPAVNFTVGTNPQGLAVADLDGDGQPDIVTANNNYVSDNSVSVLRNTGSPGNFSFATHVDLTGLPTSYCLAVGDLDGDGKLDLAVSSFINGQAVSVYRNTSTPGSITTSSFAPHADFAAGGWGNAVAIGDLDGDGKPDLAVVTQLPDHLSIFKNTSSPGSFTASSLAPRVDYSAGWNPNGVAIGDLDGDGRPDIAFDVSYAATLSIYQNQTPLFQPPPLDRPAIASFAPASGTAGTSVTISGANFSATAASNIVYFGAVRAIVSSASTTNLTLTVPAGATFAPITVTVDGLTTYSPQPFLPTFVGTGAGISADSFGPRQNLESGSGPIQVVIADLDNDGKPDLIVANDYNNTISLYRNISTDHTLTAASFAPPVDLATPTGSYSPYGIVAADVDGDGKLDIIATDYIDQNVVSVYRNTCTPGDISSNAFATRVDFATGLNPQGVAVGDIDGDGRPDLLVANTGDGTVSILRNTSVVGSLMADSFAPKVDFATGGSCANVTVGDVDGDGIPDVVTANASGTVSLLRNISSPGNFAFDTKVDFATPDGALHVKLVDLDGDGKLDVTVECYLPQTLSVFRNASTLGSLTADSLAPRIDYALGGRGHTTAVGDLDGDGKPDLAVATELDSLISIFQNAGTPGSFTNSSLASPVNLSTGWNAWGVVVGDLDGDGRPDVVFANSYDHNISIYQNQAPYAGPPTIPTQPAGQTVIEGSTALLSVAADGVPPFSYQWKFNGTNIVGGTNATLILGNLHPNQSGNYTVTISSPYGSTTSSDILVTVTAQNILIYKYSGIEKIASAGQSVSNAYSGKFFFIPDSTNGTFVGWRNIKGTKTYWVNPLSGYLVFNISGASGQAFTVIGQAGQEMDTNGQPHLWADLHKGQNARLLVGKKKFFSFPNTFADSATHLYPNPQDGSMILNEATSTYTFLSKDTQAANNNGQTMADLVNALSKALAAQGYQSQ